MKDPRLSISSEVRLFQFKRHKIMPSGEEAKFAGDLLFTWPYNWDEEILKAQPLVDKLAEDILVFISKRGADKFDLTRALTLGFIKDDLWEGIFSTPASWRESALKDEKAYRKLLLFNTYYYIMYNVEDSVEIISGDPEHAPYVKNLSHLFHKIFTFEFDTDEALQQSPHFVGAVEIVPLMKAYGLVLFDIAQELKEGFSFTASETHYFAVAAGQVFGLRAFLDGTKDESLSSAENQLKGNLIPQNPFPELRSSNFAFQASVELWMAMDGVIISDNVRDNFHWDRQVEAASNLATFLKDIFTALKAFQHEIVTDDRAVNAVMIIKDAENLTFDEALGKTIEAHNKQLATYRKEMKAMLADEQLLHDLNEEEKVVFWKSLDSYSIALSHLVQTQVQMDRYRIKLEPENYSFQPHTIQEK